MGSWFAGQAWPQITDLALALVLAGAIGVEREVRQKSAGLRTHSLVGVGAALFMLVSKYGFGDVLQRGTVVLDPSRVAAQIVTGIGFLGAGLIFVRRDAVRGLTTAASIWLTAAIGAAAGAGLWLLAVVAVAMYFVVALLLPLLAHRLPSSRDAISVICIRYPPEQGLLRRLLRIATGLGFVIEEVSHSEPQPGSFPGEIPTVTVALRVHGTRPVSTLTRALSNMEEVDAFVSDDADAVMD